MTKQKEEVDLVLDEYIKLAKKDVKDLDISEEDYEISKIASLYLIHELRQIKKDIRKVDLIKKLKLKSMRK